MNFCISSLISRSPRSHTSWTMLSSHKCSSNIVLVGCRDVVSEGIVLAGPVVEVNMVVVSVVVVSVVVASVFQVVVSPLYNLRFANE
jgi:hypothetical protein